MINSEIFFTIFVKPFIFVIFIFVVCYRVVWGSLGEFAVCHDNFIQKPPDGVLKPNTFNWLGFVQYIHTTTSLPHHSKAPRVLLIHKQFAVGTATDMLRLPQHYKLGNVVFVEYERDETECGLTRAQIKSGVKCAPMSIEVPVVDITPHPEYSRFGAKNSLALIKLKQPMKSFYMLPVCLPTAKERKNMRKKLLVFMVDYISSVPRELNKERMGKRTFQLYTHKQCNRHRHKIIKNLSIWDAHKESMLASEGLTRKLCTTGCGVRPGAPIVSHNVEGGFELIGIATGGATCSHTSRRGGLNKDPPMYIDVYHYIKWLVNVVTAHVLPSAYPQNFRRTEGGSVLALRKESRRFYSYDYAGLSGKEKFGWRGRFYLSGTSCFIDAKSNTTDVLLFYLETFKVNAIPPAKLTVKMELSGGEECLIMCVQLLLPTRLVRPIIQGVGGSKVSIFFSTIWAPHHFEYTLRLSGKNLTNLRIGPG